MKQEKMMMLTLIIGLLVLESVMPEQVSKVLMRSETRQGDITQLHRRISVRSHKISSSTDSLSEHIKFVAGRKRRDTNNFSRSRRQGSQLLPSEEENGKTSFHKKLQSSSGTVQTERIVSFQFQFSLADIKICRHLVVCKKYANLLSLKEIFKQFQSGMVMEREKQKWCWQRGEKSLKFTALSSS